VKTHEILSLFEDKNFLQNQSNSEKVDYSQPSGRLKSRPETQTSPDPRWAIKLLVSSW